MADLIISYNSEMINIPRMDNNILYKTVAISGRQMSNKYQLIDVLYHQISDKIDQVYIISNINHYYNIDDRIYNINDIKNIIKKVGMSLENKLFIIDETILSNDIWLNKHFLNILMNARYYKITMIISVSSPIIIPFDIWKLINYTYYTGERFVRNSLLIPKMYSNTNQLDDELFLEIMENISSKSGQFLCIKYGYNMTVNDLLDKNHIFWFSI